MRFLRLEVEIREWMCLFLDGAGDISVHRDRTKRRE